MKLQFGQTGQVRSNTGKSYVNIQDELDGYGLSASLHSLHSTVYVLVSGWNKAFVVVPVGFEDDFERKIAQRNEQHDVQWEIVHVWKGEERS